MFGSNLRGSCDYKSGEQATLSDKTMGFESFSRNKKYLPR